jgi:hypothetical protein
MYATAAELASYLTMFVPTTVTYQIEGLGSTQLRLPFRPVTAVSAVRFISAARERGLDVFDEELRLAASRALGWKPEADLADAIAEMVAAEMAR